MDLRNLVYEELEKAICSLTLDIISGYQSAQEYAKACGQVAGLRLAKDIMEETYRKYLAE